MVQPTLTWTWPTDLTPYKQELGSLLAASAADDGILGFADLPSEEQRAEFVTKLQQQLGGTGYVLIGSDDDGVAAMCVVHVNSMPNCAHIAEVSKAFLMPRLRGTTALYELVENVCMKAVGIGVEVFVIDVREDSKAYHVWSHLGFQTFGVLDDYVRIGSRAARGYYMTHRVPLLAARAEYLLNMRASRISASDRSNSNPTKERANNDGIYS